MGKRFTRNIRSIKDIEKQPKNTNQQNDLLSDDKHVYVRNKDQYEQITGGVKEVNGETPDENGNLNLQIKDFPWDEIEKARSDIDSSVSDVQSKASEASEDISGLVKTTEDARDNAVKSMNKLDYSDRNLIVSSKLHSYSAYSTQPVVKDNGRKISVEYKEHTNKIVSLKVDGWKPPEGKYTLSGRIEINGEPITQETFPSKRIHSNHPSAYNERFEILSDGTIIATERFAESDNGYFLHTYFDGVTDGDTITFYDLQFQRGSVPTPWQPAMGDYDAKIKRLEKAITNLGGSI